MWYASITLPFITAQFGSPRILFRITSVFINFYRVNICFVVFFDFHKRLCVYVLSCGAFIVSTTFPKQFSFVYLYCVLILQEKNDGHFSFLFSIRKPNLDDFRGFKPAVAK